MRSTLASGIAAHCTPERSMSVTRRPSTRMSVFCVPVAPKPRRSTEAEAASLPNRSFIVRPACAAISSGSVRAALRFDVLCVDDGDARRQALHVLGKARGADEHGIHGLGERRRRKRDE